MQIRNSAGHPLLSSQRRGGHRRLAMETRMEPWMRTFAVSAAVLAIASASMVSAVAQGRTESPKASSPKETADPHADQEIGKRFNVSPESLPAPKSGPVVSNAPLVLPYEGQTP